MSGSLIMSAVTVIALTGITLTTLKNNHTSDDELDYDDDYKSVTDNSTDTIEYHPKFHYTVNQNELLLNKRVAKRSNSNAPIQYNISDKNLSMIDDEKRKKVKEVLVDVQL